MPKKTTTPRTKRPTDKPATPAPTPVEPAVPTTKLSALDAAVRVLQEAGEPMTCPALIAAMATKGYWRSPGGKTPAATLTAAILREITTKGEQSRFVRVARGQFAVTPSCPATS